MRAMRAGSFAAWPLVALLANVSAVAAQQAPPPPPAPQPTQLPMPAALSVPNPLSGLRPAGPDLYQLPGRPDRFNHIPRHPRFPPTLFVPGGYAPAPYYYPYSDIPDYAARPRTESRPVNTRGGLAIETLPEAAQVFVNGFYMGEAHEFGLRGRPLDLAAGAYRVEVRATGHETLMFNALIAANDIFRYRGNLAPLSSKTVVVVPSRPPVATQVYVIANCYAGNKPPSATLPPGCDRKKLRKQ